MPDGDAPASAELSADPETMLRWLWRRWDGPVSVAGDEAASVQLHKFLKAATG
ncbi:MAG TPA: hypothetical protein VF062_13735 [Candidatus Limnocylindrales bacterium]